MSTNTTNLNLRRRKKTAVLRGRCEPKLKNEFAKFVSTTPHAEAHWIRQAVIELITTKTGKAPKVLV